MGEVVVDLRVGEMVVVEEVVKFCLDEEGIESSLVISPGCTA